MHYLPDDVPFGDIVEMSDEQALDFIRHHPGLITGVDHHERTLLHHAAEVGRFDIAKLLIDSGTPVNAIDDTNRTPLHWAANHGQIGIIEQLLLHGAVTDIRDCNGMTPLEWAEISCSGRSQAAVDAIERYKANPPQ